jgi:hypothetical protein
MNRLIRSCLRLLASKRLLSPASTYFVLAPCPARRQTLVSHNILRVGLLFGVPARPVIGHLTPRFREEIHRSRLGLVLLRRESVREHRVPKFIHHYDDNYSCSRPRQLPTPIAPSIHHPALVIQPLLTFDRARFTFSFAGASFPPTSHPLDKRCPRGAPAQGCLPHHNKRGISINLHDVSGLCKLLVPGTAPDTSIDFQHGF